MSLSQAFLPPPFRHHPPRYSGRDADRLKYPSTMSSTRPDSLPVKSVNRVVWNPNLGSHCWLLSGLLSGE